MTSKTWLVLLATLGLLLAACNRPDGEAEAETAEASTQASTQTSSLRSR